MELHINSTNGSCISACGPLTDYYIPDYILKPSSKPVTVDNVLCCPVVVLINSRSGSHLGSSLIKNMHSVGDLFSNAKS
jgi:diacylglycerol kinase (ATP)